MHLHRHCEYDQAFPITLKSTDLCWTLTVTAEIINTNIVTEHRVLHIETSLVLIYSTNKEKANY